MTKSHLVMLGYNYTLPTTGAFFFSSCLRDTDPSSTVLSAASNQRAQLRDTLKTLKRSNDKDILGVIKIIEDYLPYLFSIYTAAIQDTTCEEACYGGDETLSAISLIQKQKVIVDWRCTFYDNKLPGKAFPRLEFEGLDYEVSFILLTYAYSLSNYGLLQSSAPQRATELLTKAAGVFAYLNSHIAPRCESAKTKMTPEVYPQFSACLTSMTLGQAQLYALKQLEAKASNAILCRVAVGASDHFSTAVGLLGSHPMLKAIPFELKDHLVKSQKYALARAYQYLALESQSQGRIGFALGCVQLADTLTAKDAAITTLLRELTKENGHVTFHSVADKTEVQAKLPSGREFVKISPFTLMSIHGARVDATSKYAASDAYY